MDIDLPTTPRKTTVASRISSLVQLVIAGGCGWWAASSGSLHDRIFLGILTFAVVATVLERLLWGVFDERNDG
jgi:hypothetical protein